MTDPASPQPGTLLAGKFRIERLLGAGAMGAVYAIEHVLTHHRRALKLLHPGVNENPEIVRRFLNEASAAGRAGSPHLVETFDAGTLPSGEPYVVMELLDGETLGSLLERRGPLPFDEAAELVAQAAEGMEAAHRAGIIHRDLKPENLFVGTRDGKPFVKILDFGVSKFSHASADARATRAGAMLGSPAYMSREQIFGAADIDGRTDVFSLGVVLFEALTGRLAFEGETVEALFVRIATGEPTPIVLLRPELPPALAGVVHRALAGDRALRIASAASLAEALAPFRTSRQPAPFASPAVTAYAPAVTAATADALTVTAAADASTVTPAAPPRLLAAPAPEISSLSASSIPGLARPSSSLRVGWVLGASLGVVALVTALAMTSRRGGQTDSAPASKPTLVRDEPPPLVTPPPVTPPPPAVAIEAADAAAVVPPVSTAPSRRPPQQLAARPASSSSAASSPSSTPAPRSSAADSLGLSQDNPFH